MLILSNAILMLFSFMFSSAAYSKFTNRRYFLESLKEYRLLPEPVAGFAASVLVALEALAALLLLTPFSNSLGLLLSGCLLATYGAAIGINLLRGRRYLDCGCHGPAHRKPISSFMVLRNALLIIVLAALFSAGEIMVSSVSAWFVSVALACVVIVMFHGAQQLLENHEKMKTRFN